MWWKFRYITSKWEDDLNNSKLYNHLRVKTDNSFSFPEETKILLPIHSTQLGYSHTLYFSRKVGTPSDRFVWSKRLKEPSCDSVSNKFSLKLQILLITILDRLASSKYLGFFLSFRGKQIKYPHYVET